MKIIPLASDSLGTRSMATYIETENINILIDPAVALSPSRFNLPPHPLELKRKEEQLNLIKEKAELSSIIIITHYHYDHHNPEEISLYQNKILLIKDPENFINESQKIRAGYFLEKIKEIPKKIEIADNKEFSMENIKIKFSPPVRHGPKEYLGYVIQILISNEKEKFIFTSDVQGIVDEEQLNFILENPPTILYADGPMTYMLNYRYKKEDLEISLNNIKKIINETDVKTIILDHHLTRDENFKEYLKEILNQNKTKILTAAEYVGKENELLEAKRRELYKEFYYLYK
ncbi:MAG: MBL fold metallo-hydrolase [candidate division WOR-3 bacterium]|nr:MBL fold metallo-hydrolase [candidate division WOR-3 bacterium]MCX7837001.1 MBL fold metallo-hydrolase [candidate division WOR-3 bacterium]MDW8114079.1 MBL fold metallo-hydrolase [candidate division WOR-3 bacterium]